MFLYIGRLANEDIDNDSARDTSSDDHSTIHESFSSDDGDAGNPRNALLFQFLEQDLPYQRVPLTDKVNWIIISSLSNYIATWFAILITVLVYTIVYVMTDF